MVVDICSRYVCYLDSTGEVKVKGSHNSPDSGRRRVDNCRFVTVQCVAVCGDEEESERERREML